MVVAQSRRIDQLVEKLEQQQDKLDKQSLHLQMLQAKVSHGSSRATAHLNAAENSPHPSSCYLQVSHRRLKPHRRRDGETAARREETQQAAGEETQAGIDTLVKPL